MRLATNYARGEVAPDGSIWLSPTSRANAGIVQITEAEAAKAGRFGWVALNDGKPNAFGLVQMTRVG